MAYEFTEYLVSLIRDGQTYFLGFDGGKYLLTAEPNAYSLRFKFPDTADALFKEWAGSVHLLDIR